LPFGAITKKKSPKEAESNETQVLCSPKTGHSGQGIKITQQQKLDYPDVKTTC